MASAEPRSAEAEAEAEAEVALARADADYGLGGELAAVLAEHYPHLRDPQRVYIDYAGGAVPSQRVLAEGAALAGSTVWSNPHSTGELAFPSDPSPQLAAVRAALLELLHAPPAEYDVVLALNASHALKLVGECVPWRRGSVFLHAFEAHNSLLGLRELAAAAGAQVRHFSFYTEATAALLADALARHAPEDGAAPALLAMPLACNVTGRTAAANDVCGAVRAADASGQWLVLLDAAGAVGKVEVSVAALGRPHLLAFSLFKSFGWPHLGALLVRRDVGARLRRAYFGGGTVQAVSAEHGGVRIDRDALHERLEAGTLPFLAAIQALPAVALFQRLQPRRIHRHVLVLWRLLRARLAALTHASGAPLVVFYRAVPAEAVHAEAERQSGVLCLNFLRPDGRPVPLDEVAERAVAAGVQLRVGGFCNPGAMERAVGVPAARAALAAQHGARCGLGAHLLPSQVLGAVRLSLGLTSTLADVSRVVRWAHASFALHETAPAPARAIGVSEAGVRVAGVLVYPVKSGGAFRPAQAWPVRATGLYADRDWMLVERASLRPLSQKQLPALALLRPTIDLAAHTLTLTHPAAPGALALPLSPPPPSVPSVALRTGALVTVCSDADTWLAHLAPGLMLVRRCPHSSRAARNRTAATATAAAAAETDSAAAAPLLSLANESQFLVVCDASVADLNSRLPATVPPVPAARFRPNLVLAGGSAYQEDSWAAVRIGALALRVRLLSHCVLHSPPPSRLDRAAGAR